MSFGFAKLSFTRTHKDFSVKELPNLIHQKLIYKKIKIY